MYRTVLITGGSSDIGYALAQVFAANKDNLVLVAKNLEGDMLQAEDDK